MIDTFTMETQAERSTGVVTAILRDETGAPVAKASMTSLTLTLYERTTGAILNSRRNQNVLDANNVTMGVADGLVTWALQPADMAIVSQLTAEAHVALFVAKWSGGTKERPWQVILPVVNYQYAPP